VGEGCFGQGIPSVEPTGAARIRIRASLQAVHARLGLISVGQPEGVACVGPAIEPQGSTSLTRGVAVVSGRAV
jgi:hypothetical protein